MISSVWFKRCSYAVKMGILYALVAAAVISAFKTPMLAATPIGVARLPVAAQPLLRSGRPVWISLPEQSIKLQVKNGTYDPKTQAWTLTSTSAHYASITQQPGEMPGNTFIYGHNRPQVLGPTAAIKRGDALVIKTSNGLRITYRYARDEVVDPTNTKLFTRRYRVPRLTLMTCTGAQSQWRRLMVFELVRVRSVN